MYNIIFVFNYRLYINSCGYKLFICLLIILLNYINNISSDIPLILGTTMFIVFIICSKIKNEKREGEGRTRTNDKLRVARITGSKNPLTKEVE